MSRRSRKSKPLSSTTDNSISDALTGQTPDSTPTDPPDAEVSGFVEQAAGLLKKADEACKQAKHGRLACDIVSMQAATAKRLSEFLREPKAETAEPKLGDAAAVVSARSKTTNSSKLKKVDVAVSIADPESPAMVAIADDGSDNLSDDE